jgi:hypothetical protein
MHSDSDVFTVPANSSDGTDRAEHQDTAQHDVRDAGAALVLPSPVSTAPQVGQLSGPCASVRRSRPQRVRRHQLPLEVERLRLLTGPFGSAPPARCVCREFKRRSLRRCLWLLRSRHGSECRGSGSVALLDGERGVPLDLMDLLVVVVWPGTGRAARPCGPAPDLAPVLTGLATRGAHLLVVSAAGAEELFAALRDAGLLPHLRGAAGALRSQRDLRAYLLDHRCRRDRAVFVGGGRGRRAHGGVGRLRGGQLVRSGRCHLRRR